MIWAAIIRRPCFIVPKRFFSIHFPYIPTRNLCVPLGTAVHNAPLHEDVPIKETHMAIDQLMKALLAADKPTLEKVADVLTHRERPAAPRVNKETRLITQRDAAKRLSISTTSLWRLIKENAIETVNVRGRRRVRLASLEEFALGKDQA